MVVILSSFQTNYGLIISKITKINEHVQITTKQSWHVSLFGTFFMHTSMH